jgi:DNA-binding NarL/FixJ family response regulator
LDDLTKKGQEEWIMNPVTVELLNNVEKDNRSRQVATLQLQNQAQDVQSGQLNPLKRLLNRLGILPICAGQRRKEWTPAPRQNLTPREREVLALMVEGLNNPQIGDRLLISVTAVRSYVSNVLLKLGVSNRTEAITLALHDRLET